MQMPDQTWIMTYSADRRKHSHRCVACSRIVGEGQEVIMLRQDRGSKVVHLYPCSTNQHSPGVTYGEAFRLWGIERNARLGFREAKAIVDVHPFFRAGGVA
jgi:hypothetical protein